MSVESEPNVFLDDEGAISLVGWMLLRTWPVRFPTRFSDDEGAISLVGWMLLRTYPIPHFKLSILYDNVYYGVNEST